MKVYRDVSELRKEFSSRQNAIRERLAQFAAVPQEDYFYELVYCVLTPQSSAVNASRVVDELRLRGFERLQFDAADILRRKEHYIRFHNAKARHLDRAKDLFPEIVRQLECCPQSAADNDVRALRFWITRHVHGLGWKESSHFLRNIGYRNLAILDRHILRNLQRHAVIRSIPQTLTPRRYSEIEGCFQEFAATIGMAMDELDLLFWSRETGEILK
jgi:N-glycosylase/DNA lyase